MLPQDKRMNVLASTGPHAPPPCPPAASALASRFQPHAQPVGNAIDIVEVGHDLIEVEDRAVVPALSVQGVKIRPCDRGGLLGHTGGVAEQGPLTRGDRGRQRIDL